MVELGCALFRYYHRLPATGSSSSSSGLTPPTLPSGSCSSSTSQSVSTCHESAFPACSSQAASHSVCEKPRKRKATHALPQRRRSNPAVTLLQPDAEKSPMCTPVVSPESVHEVILLSSDGSVQTLPESATAAESLDDARVRKGKCTLPVVEDVDDLSDDEFEPTLHGDKVPKKNYDATRKFQETWAAKLPWAELFRGSDGLFQSVRCVVCSQITGKPKILGPKWDTLVKHSGKRKATKNMALGIKKGQWYVAKNCKHLRNERLYAARNSVTVAQQLAVVKGERARKRLQFATILHLLQNGRPMLEYAALQPLFTFLDVPKLPKRHWSDSAGWSLAECLHHQVQLKTREVMSKARFFSVSCDEVTTLDTQSWISIHGYVCDNWERKPMLLSLERVVDGGGSDSLTSVIVGALKNSAGLKEADFVNRLASFGAGISGPHLLHMCLHVCCMCLSDQFNLHGGVLTWETVESLQTVSVPSKERRTEY